MQPGMSMAAVAMAHGVNANLLRRWVRDAEMNSATTVVSATTVEGARSQDSVRPGQLAATSAAGS